MGVFCHGIGYLFYVQSHTINRRKAWRNSVVVESPEIKSTCPASTGLHKTPTGRHKCCCCAAAQASPPSCCARVSCFCNHRDQSYWVFGPEVLGFYAEYRRKSSKVHPRSACSPDRKIGTKSLSIPLPSNKKLITSNKKIKISLQPKNNNSNTYFYVLFFNGTLKLTTNRMDYSLCRCLTQSPNTVRRPALKC